MVKSKADRRPPLPDGREGVLAIHEGVDDFSGGLLPFDFFFALFGRSRVTDERLGVFIVGRDLLQYVARIFAFGYTGLETCATKILDLDAAALEEVIHFLVELDADLLGFSLSLGEGALAHGLFAGSDLDRIDQPEDRLVDLLHHDLVLVTVLADADLLGLEGHGEAVELVATARIQRERPVAPAGRGALGLQVDVQGDGEIVNSEW